MIRKILLIRFSSLGDIVMTTAMIRCVREAFPFAQIDMVVREDFLDLIRYNPHLDNKIGLPRGEGMKGLRRFLATANREHYDLVYDAHRSLRTLFLMPLLRAEHKAYFQKHYVKRDLALTFKLPLIKNMPRFLERYIQPLERFGVKYDGKGPEIHVTEKVLASALQKVPLPDIDDKTLGMVPSAQWPGKRWSLEGFREVMERLVNETNHRLVVFGGREDTFCEALCRNLPPHRVINAQGKLTIAESGALLKKCDAVVANDTGLMHMADALGVPSVLILGPTSGDLGCLPFHPRSEILEHDLWCRPCSKNGQAPCIRKKRYCLELTTPNAVFSAVGKVLTWAR